MDARQFPVFLVCRDRVTDLARQVEWLERAGHQRIVLVDNDSTWEPLLDYLDRSPHEVVYLDANVGSRAVWDRGLVPNGSWFVVSDPDIIPTDDCPTDLVAHLHELLLEHPGFLKAGVGLYLDDVPADLPSLEWERGLISPEREIAPAVFSSLVDTTFALYRPNMDFVYEAIRTGAPYQARHTTWYLRPEDLDAEHLHYLARAKHGTDGSSWAQTRSRP